MNCGHCSTQLDRKARGRRRMYCSPTCRQAAYRKRNPKQKLSEPFTAEDIAIFERLSRQLDELDVDKFFEGVDFDIS
jgi:hypothetical protein